MKKLLFVTAIAGVCCAQVFAGSSCKTCPTAPQQETTTPDSKTEAEKTKENPTLNLLAANADAPATTGTVTPDSTDSTQDPTKTTPDSTTPAKMLLAGGNQPSATEVPAAEGEKKADKDQKDLEKQTAPQLLA